MTPGKKVYCSFCGAGEDEYSTVVSDGETHVCAECIHQCSGAVLAKLQAVMLSLKARTGIAIGVMESMPDSLKTNAWEQETA